MPEGEILCDDTRSTVLPPVAVDEPSSEPAVVDETQYLLSVAGVELEMRVLWELVRGRELELARHSEVEQDGDSGGGVVLASQSGIQ